MPQDELLLSKCGVLFPPAGRYFAKEIDSHAKQNSDSATNVNKKLEIIIRSALPCGRCSKSEKTGILPEFLAGSAVATAISIQNFSDFSVMNGSPAIDPQTCNLAVVERNAGRQW